MIFVDACAIVSIMASEPTAPEYESALTRADAAATSALAVWEAVIVLSRPDRLNCRCGDAKDAVVEWLDARGIGFIETVTQAELLDLAVSAAENYGLGRKALSNLDCFHYAYAKAADVPLLSLDRALRKTDVETLP